MSSPLARFLVAFLSLAILGSCGRGGVSGPAPVDDPTRITILPGTATAFGGLPTTFQISGGTGSYIVSSSNQAVIPVSGGISGHSLTVVPNQVSADTTVTITVRDTGSTPLATATVTVRPGTVTNNISITPTSTQGGSCSPAICSGGDAEVTATLAQGGIALSNRAVRFEVISGDFRFITSNPGAIVETLDTSVTVFTDEQGRARARIRIPADAPNQTALLQVTDTSTGAFQRTSFVIAQATGTSPGFFASPSHITFQGALQGQCAGNEVSGGFSIFGGVPPYTISPSGGFFVSNQVVTSSGGSFNIIPNGTCVAEPGAPITIRDSAGRTVIVTAANIPGTTAPPALVVTPDDVTLSTCSGSANVTIAGGRNNNYVASSGSDTLVVSISGNTLTIRRRNPSGDPGPDPVNVGVSDGTTVANVTVHASGACFGQFFASPLSVSLSSCDDLQPVNLTGGSGFYTATSNNTSVIGEIVNTPPAGPRTMSVRRRSFAIWGDPTGSPGFTPPALITVFDTNDPAARLSVNVTGTVAGTGPCP